MITSVRIPVGLLALGPGPVWTYLADSFRTKTHFTRMTVWRHRRAISKFLETYTWRKGTYQVVPLDLVITVLAGKMDVYQAHTWLAVSTVEELSQPKVELIAARLNMSHTKTYERLRSLREAGFLTIEHRTFPNGLKAPSNYTLNREALVDVNALLAEESGPRHTRVVPDDRKKQTKLNRKTKPVEKWSPLDSAQEIRDQLQQQYGPLVGLGDTAQLAKILAKHRRDLGSTSAVEISVFEDCLQRGAIRSDNPARKNLAVFLGRLRDCLRQEAQPQVRAVDRPYQPNKRASLAMPAYIPR